jgi:hypothetical protein
MGREPDPSPSPATARVSNAEAVAQLVIGALWFAILVGAIFFTASMSARTALAVGLGLFLVELSIFIALVAVGWSGPKRPIPLAVFAFGWVGWNVISGMCLDLYVLASYPRSYPLPLLEGILCFALALAPIVVTVALAVLVERVRRWLVSRHVGPGDTSSGRTADAPLL